MGLAFLGYTEAHAGQGQQKPAVRPAPGHASASAPDKLSLAEVLAAVEAHYPWVISATQDREKAKAELLSAQGGFDPTLRSVYQATPSGEYENRYFDTVLEQPTPLWGTKLFVGYRNGQGLFGPYDERLLTNDGGEVRGGLELPLLRGGLIDERRARIGTNRSLVEASERSLEVQKIDSKRQASHRYFEWIAAAEKLKVAREMLTLAVTRDEAMRHRVARGDAARIEQTDNQRSVTQREAALVSARRAFDKAALELSLFLRDREGRPVVASFDQLPEKGFESLTLATDETDGAARPEKLSPDAMQRHPELRRIQAQVDQNQIEQKLARNSILPKLDAELLIAQDLGPGSSKKSDIEYKAALKLEFPLLLRAGRGKSDAVAAQGVKLDAQLDFARDRLRMAISDSSQALDASKKRLSFIRREIEQSLQVEHAERLKLKHGDSNILTVNLREQSTADARARLIDAFTDYFRAQADLTAATARTQD